MKPNLSPILTSLTLLTTLFPPHPTLAAPARDPAYPKADPAHAFSELKIYGADGSPLRMPKDDWDGAKQRAVSDAAWKTWVIEQRADMDDWMAKRRDHPEWTAGWYHNFVSPKDGSHLTWTADEPGEYSLHSPSDPRVKLTPKLRAAWVYSFRNSMANHMLLAARLYRLTGERKYADWTASQLNFYADNFAAWPMPTGELANPAWKGGPPSGVRLMWQSLDEAVDLCRYVEAARTLGDYVTPAQKASWSEKLFLPDATILNGTMRTVHNIATWHRAAAGYVAVYTGDPAMWKTAVDAWYGVRYELARGVTSDYIWREQSFGYNSYVARALTPFFIFAMENGYGAKLTPEMETTENLLLSPLYLRFATGQLPNPCDEGAPANVDNTEVLADFARLYPTTIGVDAARARHDWDTLIDPPAATGGSPALPPVTSRNLESARMAILKRGDWQAYIHYGQITRSHSQAEALNYELFHGKTDVSHDAGTSGYGSPLHEQFFATGLAHNIPLVDGVGEVGIHPGTVLGYDGSAARLSVAIPDYWPNGSAQRDISLADDRFTDTTTVKTTDGKPHELGLLLQSQGKVTLPAAFQPDAGAAAPGPTRPAGFQRWTNVTSASFTDSAAFDVSYADGTTLHLTIHLPGPFTITHATTLDSPPKKREVLFVHTTGTSAVFETVMAGKD